MAKTPLTTVLWFVGFLGLFVSEVYSNALFELPQECRKGVLESYVSGFNLADFVIKFGTPYPAGVNCRLHIVVTGEEVNIELKWLFMDMKGPDPNGVCEDFIQIFKKDPTTGAYTSVTQRLCGTTLPATKHEDVNEVILWVKTVAPATHLRGFRMQYKRVSKPQNPDGSTVDTNPKTGLQPGIIAAIVVGAILFLLVIIFIVACIYCCCQHHEDVLKPDYVNSATVPLAENRYTDETLAIAHSGLVNPAASVVDSVNGQALTIPSPDHMYGQAPQGQASYWGNRWRHSPWVMHWR